MAFFCMNAQEEALREIAIQMKVSNEFKVLQELRDLEAITDEDYIERLRRLYKRAHD